MAKPKSDEPEIVREAKTETEWEADRFRRLMSNVCLIRRVGTISNDPIHFAYYTAPNRDAAEGLLKLGQWVPDKTIYVYHFPEGTLCLDSYGFFEPKESHTFAKLCRPEIPESFIDNVRVEPHTSPYSFPKMYK